MPMYVTYCLHMVIRKKSPKRRIPMTSDLFFSSISNMWAIAILAD